VSKVNELRRKATQAIRSRKWDEAAKLLDTLAELLGVRDFLGNVRGK